MGICSEASATYPEIAALLRDLGVDSISVNPQSLPRTRAVVREAEGARAQRAKRSRPVAEAAGA